MSRICECFAPPSPHRPSPVHRAITLPDHATFAQPPIIHPATHDRHALPRPTNHPSSIPPPITVTPRHHPARSRAIRPAHHQYTAPSPCPITHHPSRRPPPSRRAITPPDHAPFAPPPMTGTPRHHPTRSRGIRPTAHHRHAAPSDRPRRMTQGHWVCGWAISRAIGCVVGLQGKAFAGRG
jgi:hypothetical protein